jgi:hypothetical protein
MRQFFSFRLSLKSSALLCNVIVECGATHHIGSL